MKKIRIQNDITIKWRIYRMGEEEVLTGKNVSVKLFNAFGKTSPITFSISGNEVTVLYEGRNQEFLGDYTLVLTENGGETGMVTIDKVKCFTLVKHSIDEGGCPINMCDVETVDIASDIDIPAKGLSAYDIWLLEGHDGTREDFLNWIKQDCFVTSITEEGILTDSNGKKWKLTAYEEMTDVVTMEYSNPIISLTYPKVSAEGGHVSPILSYTQQKIVKRNGVVETTETITTGAILTYEGVNMDGSVDVEASNVTTEHVVATSTVTVSINGKTASKSVEIIQSAYSAETAISYYVGNLVATRSEFQNLSDETLTAGATKKDITRNESTSFLSNKSCMYLMIPASLTLMTFTYTSGGLTTNVLGNSLWNLTHNDVVIDGVTYKVYGYRLGVVNEGNTQLYKYSININ